MAVQAAADLIVEGAFKVAVEIARGLFARRVTLRRSMSTPVALGEMRSLRVLFRNRPVKLLPQRSSCPNRPKRLAPRPCLHLSSHKFLSRHQWRVCQSPRGLSMEQPGES